MKTKILILSLLCLAGATVSRAQVNNARMLSTPNAQTGTTYTFVAADTTRIVTFSNANPIAATLPNGATFGFGSGTVLTVANIGAGTLTITCSSCTITANGSAASTLVLTNGQGADIYGGFGSSAVNYIAFVNSLGIGGTLTTNQVAYGLSANTIGGSPNFQYGSSVANALNLNMPGASCVNVGTNQHGCSVVAVTNSSASTTTYIGKFTNNEFFVINDDLAIPSHGKWEILSDGSIAFTAGGTGAAMQLYATAGTFPSGSVGFSVPPNGFNTTVFSLNQPTGSTGAATYQWNASTGISTWYPNNATSPTVTLTPPASGSFSVPIEICSGQIALSTGAINSGTRATNTLSCSGLSATTDTINCTFSGDTNGVTGYAPSASGGLSLKTWASTNTINVDQVNDTGGSITPGAATVNCKAIR